MSKESFRDLKNELELKNAEIDELYMELEAKKEEINKLKLYSTKLKYLNKNLEDKLDTKIDYDKATMKELDDLQEKIKEKDMIIEDKHDQVKYLRSLIDDYKHQINSNTENSQPLCYIGRYHTNRAVCHKPYGSRQFVFIAVTDLSLSIIQDSLFFNLDNFLSYCLLTF